MEDSRKARRNVITQSLVLHAATVAAVVVLGVRMVDLERRIQTSGGDALVRRLLEAPRLKSELHHQIDTYVQGRVQKLQAEREAQVTGPAAGDAAPPRIRPGEIVYGPADAAITLVVYSDYECPFCRQYFGIPQQVVDAAAGGVNLVYRHLPLQMHGKAARSETVAAECVAANGGDYWQFSAEVYRLTRGNGEGLEQPLGALMQRAGITRAQLERCMQDPSVPRRIQENLQSARALAVSATPTTIVVDNRSGRTRRIGGLATARHLTETLAGLR